MQIPYLGKFSFEIYEWKLSTNQIARFFKLLYLLNRSTVFYYEELKGITTSVIDSRKAEGNEQRNPGMYTDQQKQSPNEPIYKISVKLFIAGIFISQTPPCPVSYTLKLKGVQVRNFIIAYYLICVSPHISLVSKMGQRPLSYEQFKFYEGKRMRGIAKYIGNLPL